VAIPYGCAKQCGSPDAQKKPPFSRNVIKLRKTGSHRDVGSSFFVTISKKHLTNGEKCAAFLLIAISKKALVIRSIPPEITRRHLHEESGFVSEREIRCMHFSVKRSLMDVFKETRSLLYTK
jgi:hypothetical protein